MYFDQICYSIFFFSDAGVCMGKIDPIVLDHILKLQKARQIAECILSSLYSYHNM